MSRKPLNSAAGPARIVPVKMPEGLIAIVRWAANDRGVSLSEYVRDVVEKAAEKDIAKASKRK